MIPPLESPCINICALSPQHALCLGCHRTLEEIAAWSTLSPAARRAILAELPQRRPS